MWTSWVKRDSGWRDCARQLACRGGGTRIRRITNAHSSEPVAPSKGRFASVSVWVEHLPPDVDLFDQTIALAQAAEKSGFDMVTVMDHFYQIGVVGPEDEPMLEAYTTLGALAMKTDRVLLGTMVTGVTYRNPAMLAKIATTLDVISKGRAVLGLGAVWN